MIPYITKTKGGSRMTEKSEITWVTVYEADGEMDAEIIKGLLESSGIECVLDENEAPYIIMGIPTHITVSVKVMESDALVARELIEQPPSVEYE